MFAQKEYVANLCFESFKSFRGMLQVFYIGVVYVAMVVQVYMLQRSFTMFYMCLRTYVVSVFIWILHMFHTCVACVLSRYCVCLQRFSSVLKACCKCMFQMFQLFSEIYVANVFI
jgi:hypothetical protein